MTARLFSSQHRQLAFAALCGVGLLAAARLAPPLSAQQAQPTPLSYTTEQADKGFGLYAEHCASCHGKNLDDGAYAPPLKGIDFRQKWGVRSAEPLFTYTSTKMPPSRPGTLGDPVYAQLLSYILQENGAPAGGRELPGDPDALKALSAPNWPRPGGGGLAPQVTLPPAPPRVNPLDKIRPVTDALLTKVPDGEWLLWRRTYEAFGYSPLKKINKANVNELRVA